MSLNTEDLQNVPFVPLIGNDATRPLAERVREIANMDHPWIPGAQADLIKEIAETLETIEDAAIGLDYSRDEDRLAAIRTALKGV